MGDSPGQSPAGTPKKYVTVKPHCLVFQPPFGVEKQNDIITIHNTCAHSVAFKMEVNRPKLYAIRPNHAVIQAKQSKVVDIELIDSLTERDIRAETSKHKFQVCVIKWPSHQEAFDHETYKRLEKSGDVQRLTVEADFNIQRKATKHK